MRSAEELGRGVVRVARRNAGRGLRRLGLRPPVVAAPASSVEPAVPAVAVRPTPPPEVERPVPEGWTEDELRGVMRTFAMDGGPEGAMDPYLDDAFWRFLHSWGLVRGERGLALELGANPYYITWLVQQFTELDVSLANYFGSDATELVQSLSWRDRAGELHEEQLTSRLFNLEAERFPYADESFDVVLFCEIIEHLLVDPLHAIREIHRVLRPGGLFVVTTPNVARLGNVLALAAGENLYDPYSGYGAYGRHNREFTLHELVKLLEFAGFTASSTFTANAHPEDYASRFAFDEVMPTVQFRANDLGQYLFVGARKTGAGRRGFPSWLYRSLPDDQLVGD